MKEKTYTTFQVADICGVRPTTIIKWANQNKIKVYTTLGGHRRVTHSDLIDFLTQNKLPIPEDLDYMNESKKILVISEDTAFGRSIISCFETSLFSIKSRVDSRWNSSFTHFGKVFS